MQKAPIGFGEARSVELIFPKKQASESEVQKNSILSLRIPIVVLKFFSPFSRSSSHHHRPSQCLSAFTAAAA